MPLANWLPHRLRTRRVRTPTVLQMEAVECGAASLGIVLGHFGRIVPLEELRLACGVTRDGSKASDLVRAARQYGLTAKGFRKEPAELLDMPLPVIVYWNFNHFLVVEGYSRRGVYLNDPASGRRLVSAQEFDESFTGLAITFSPGADFTTGGEKHSLLRSLQRRFKDSQAGLIYAVLASLGLVAPGLIIPGLVRMFVDGFLVQQRSEWLGVVFAGMATAALLRGAFTWLQQSALLRLEMRLALSNSSQFFWRLLRLPIFFYYQRSAGEIGSRVAMNDRVARLLSGDLATAMLDILTAVFFAAAMFSYHLTLALVGVSAALLNLAVLAMISRRRVDTNRRLLLERGKLAGVAMHGLLTVENLKASGAENDFFARWAGYQAKTLNAEQQLGISTQLLAVVPSFLSVCSSAAILLLGSQQVMQGNLSVGALVAFQSLLVSFSGPVNRLVGLGSLLHEVVGELFSLDDALDAPADAGLLAQENAPAAQSPARLSGRLEVRGLTFGYNRFDAPLIENFDLSLRPGDRVALVGGSGSGKSTIARLIAGLYQPWAGEILFDGLPRSQVPRRAITSSVAMVDQDIFLFEGAVRDNLTLWDDTISTAVILEASRDACIHDDIASRPQGYDGLIEEDGRNFSGGQRQRLEIARALTTQPALLIMDEATSALDALTEKQIDDNLRRRGCTCLIVAHRLSTIRDCDEIIVLQNGRIVQRGTHESLTREGGAYARLVQADTAAPRKSRLQTLLERLE